MNKRPWHKWTESEDVDLERVWTAPGPMKLYVHLFNGRSVESVLSYGYARGLGTRPNRNSFVGRPSMSAILRVLAGAAMDSTEIAAKTGLSRRVVMKHLNVLHANGSIYIERWERFGVSGYPARLFAIGSRRDAPRPTARSPGQKWRDRMEDLKKNRPDEYARLLTRRRANAQRRAGRKAMRDIAAQALFGEAAA